MLAVSVDLGWPWWVTSLLAAAIGVGAVVVLVMSRGRQARAVALTVLVEAIAIAAIAPTVMADASMGSPKDALSPGEFARRADANCRELGERTAMLRDPQGLAATARYMDAFLPQMHRAYMKQGLLVPPEEEAVRAMRWMNAMAAFGDDLEKLRDAAKRRDAAAVTSAQERSNTDAEAAARLSRELGLSVCFS